VRLALYARAIVENRRGGVPAPLWCTYLVSYRCNARCGMCDSWRMKPGSELTTAEVDRIFADVGPLEVVRLTGGEPFLRQDFGELAARVFERSRPGVLHVTTNGSFPDEIAAFVAGFPAPERLRFLVSFDGLAAEHDENRGDEVTFDRAFESVGRLLAWRSRGVRVSVNHTVISAGSLADAPALRARFAPLGVDVQSVLAYSESATYAIKLRGKRAEHLIHPRGYPLHPKLAGSDVVGFVDSELRATRAIRDPLVRLGKRYYLRGLRARLLGQAQPSGSPRCVAVRSHLRIQPDGSVPVCQFNGEVLGNLRDQSLSSIWFSEPAARARSWVDACPGCWAECEVLPSAVLTGDIVRALLPESRRTEPPRQS
jgi:MoaA/NifB/PqqE/SkfB family radical SAM enzyme